MSSKVNEERETSVRSKEERLRNLLVHFESYIVAVKRILIWERPLVSAVIFVVVNVIFWTATCLRLFSLIGVTGFAILAAKSSTDYIWSQMNAQGTGINVTEHGKARETHDESPLRLSQLSHSLAEHWQSMEEAINQTVILRQTHRAKFFIYSVFTLSTLAVIGMYVPGVYIVYCTVMGLLLWPGAQHHGVTEWICHHVHPVTADVEQKLNIKRRRRSKKGAAGAEGQTDVSKLQTPPVKEETDSDEGLDEFMPRPLSSELRAALHGAMTANDSCATDESLDIMPSLTSYLTSDVTNDSLNDYSLGHSDDDILSDDLPYFARGLGKEMPSINSALESIPPFALNFPVDEMPSFDNIDSMPYSITNVQNLSNKISFEPSHDREPSESSEVEDIKALSSGLNFGDMTEVLEAMAVSDLMPESKNVVEDVTSCSSFKPLPVTLTPPLNTVTPSTYECDEMSGDIAAVIKDAVTGIDTLAADERRGSEEKERVGEEVGDLLDTEFEFLDREELESLGEQS